MKPVIFADLDDSLFSTMKAFPGVDPSSLQRVTDSEKGKFSYFCDQRKALFDWFSQTASLVPVTARGYREFNRVLLDFSQGAILANGAIILKQDMTRDRAWDARISDILQTYSGLFSVARDAVSASSAHCARVIEHRDPVLDLVNGMTFKSTLEGTSMIRSDLDRVESVLRDEGLLSRVSVHRNSNYLFLVPEGISKKLAVEHLKTSREDLAGRPTIGFGDSLSDLGFMSLCNLMLLPQGTQNSQKLLREVGDGA